MAADPGTRTPATGIARWQMPALIVGVLGILASAGMAMVSETWKIDFFRAWLTSYLYWFSIAAGSLAVLMLQYVTGGEWGLMVRRPLGAAARTMWLLLLLFIPILLGMKQIYPWMNGELMQHEEELRVKLPWLNLTRFLIFLGIYFALWILWAWRIRALSLKFYEDRAPETELKRRKWAATGLLMIVLTLTFASIDWMMSIEPGWFSSMYGIYFLVGCALSAFAFVTFFLTRLADTPAMAGVLKPSHLRDLGNLMLAFVMFYAYTSFSEFLLIWYGNIKEEIPHYLWREHGAWGWVAAAVVLFHFFLPFFLLLMRSIKDRASTIGWVTVIILVMRYVTLYWVVAPSWTHAEFHYSPLCLTTLVGIGGVWMWAFIGQLKGQTIIPIHETWVEEAIREGAVKIHG
jgi:hypothetical protein